jgi:hypothetical protein
MSGHNHIEAVLYYCFVSDLRFSDLLLIREAIYLCSLLSEV